MYVKIHFFLARFARKFNYHYLQHLLAMLGVDTYNCFPFCRYSITLPVSPTNIDYGNRRTLSFKCPF